MAPDLGTVRTGVALSDPTQTIATPSDRPAKGVDTKGFVEQIRDMAEADAVERVIVGIPRSLDGKRGPMAHWAERIRRELANALTVPVDPWDERFSSNEAAHRMRTGGASSRDMRGRLDSAAAAVILEDYLNARRLERPGESDAGRSP